MLFSELIKAKDLAAERASHCEADETNAHAVAKIVMEQTTQAREKAVATREDLFKAIHILLTERGEHSLIDDKGTLTIYRRAEDYPGFIAYQPIPGTPPVPKKV